MTITVDWESDYECICIVINGRKHRVPLNILSSVFLPSHLEWGYIENVELSIFLIGTWHVGIYYIFFKSNVHSSCVWSSMLHASETWQLIQQNLAVLRWGHDQTDLQYQARGGGPLRPREQEDLDLILVKRRLCWYGHGECSSTEDRTCRIEVD